MNSRRDITERKRAEEARAHLAAIVETTGDAIVSCAPDGTVLSWNASAARILGYPAAEIVRRNISIIAPPDRRHEMQHHEWLLQHGKSVPPFETIRVAKDGRLVDVQMTVSAIPDAAGGVTRIAYIFRDVTELKQAQRGLERKAAITRLMELLARATNEAATPQAALRACLEHVCAHGHWTLGRLAILRPGSDAPVVESSLWHDHDLTRFAEFMRVSETYDYARPTGKFISTVLRDKRPMWIEDFQEAKAAGRLPVAVKAGLLAGFAFPVIVQDKVTAFLEFFSGEPREPDPLLVEAATAIGSQLARVIERQRALDEARASEQKLSGILGALHEVVWSMDARSGRLLYLNAAAKRLARRPVTDFLAHPRLWRRMIHPDDRARLRTDVRALLEQGELTHAFRITLADGEVRVVENRARVVRDAHGVPQRIDGTITDITERKYAEQARAQLAAIVENSNDAIIGRSLDGAITSWNAGAERIFGYSESEMIGHSITILVPEGHRHLKDNNEGLRRGDAIPASERIRVTKDGRVINVQSGISPIKNEAGEVVGAAVIVRDITERKQAEQARAQLVAIVENSNDAIIGRLLDGTITSWNAAAERLYGYTAEEAVGQRALLLTPPELRDETEQNRQLLTRGIPVPPYETVRLTKDGRRIDVQMSLSPIRDGSGNVIGASSNSHDISERKRVEAERALLAAIVQGSADAIYSRAPDGTVLSWNSGAERIFGYTAAEMVGRNISIIAPPELAQYSGRNTEALLRGESVPPFETVRLAKGGRPVDVQISVSPIRDAAGKLTAIAAIIGDISERKRADAERARLATIVENSSDAIISRSLDRTILTWNAGAERLFGWSAREAIGQSIYLIVPPERRGENTRYRNLVHKGIPVPTYDTMRLAKDGRRIDVSLSQSAIKNERGDVTAVSLFFRDVTERKRAEAERARLAAIVENATDAIIGRSLDGAITSWNAGAERMLGWSAQEALGRPAAFVIAPEHHERVARNNEKVLGGEIVPPHETKRIAKDGRVIDVLSSISPIRDDTGEIVGAANMLQDISALKQAEAALKESEERFRATFEQAGVGMGLRAIDPRNPRWLRVNQKLCEIFGYTEEELLQLTTVDLTPPEDRGTAIDYNEQLLRGEITSYSREKRYLRKDGSIIWTNIALAAVRGPEGLPTHVISVIQDITERKQAEERIGFLAQYDMVTGLPNRQLFSDRLTLAMARDKRLGSMTALLHLDLDRFKQINETLGQSAGDEALQRVTARLRDRLREVDTIARLGGDEFAVILESVTEKGQALRVAEKIMEAMADPLVLKGEDVFVTASIGIAVYPADADSMEKLIESAELAMYQAKQEGRNTAQLYIPDPNPRRSAGLGMESRLRRALERDELLLHFQPKVDIRTGAITGAEALVRWRNPDLGMVSPADFIPIAEETGLIVPIGEWVLHSACAQAAAWHREGHPISMAVNLSARQFRQSSLCEMVELALADSALEAGHLELEITESMIMHRPEQTIATLQRLHDIGLILSVDDFGTGYSSLSYLKRFPVHKLKIDQSFVRELHKNADDSAIVRAVIALATSLNLKTVAEGVETEQQLIYLAGLQCDEYQGYYFSKPLPAAEFLRLLQARSTTAHAAAAQFHRTAKA